MCGKNSQTTARSQTTAGSPPRVREKSYENDQSSITLRITPACAGKILFLPFYILQLQDHPRVCGKNYDEHGEFTFKRGSPPRVREKFDLIQNNTDGLGITPACAGKIPALSFGTTPR